MKSISDVVGASGLAGYAEIALIIFFAVFMAVLIRVVFSRSRSWEHAAHLPLDDDSHPEPFAALEGRLREGSAVGSRSSQPSGRTA